MGKREKWTKETFHWCPKKEQMLNLVALSKICPQCEKPNDCTAWRKYHSIAYPKVVA